MAQNVHDELAASTVEAKALLLDNEKMAGAWAEVWVDAKAHELDSEKVGAMKRLALGPGYLYLAERCYHLTLMTPPLVSKLALRSCCLPVHRERHCHHLPCQRPSPGRMEYPRLPPQLLRRMQRKWRSPSSRRRPLLTTGHQPRLRIHQ